MNKVYYGLVTGGNRGIGLALIRILLAADPSLHIFLGSRSYSSANHAILSLPSPLQSRVTGIELDVTSSSSLENARDAVLGVTTSLRLLVNNAGILGETDSKEATMATNFFGVINTTNVFLPLLEREECNMKDDLLDASTVIVTSSSCGVRFLAGKDESFREKILSETLSVPGLTDLVNEDAATTDDIYSTTKMGANMFVKIKAREMAPKVRFASVSPGFTSTDMCKNYTGSRKPKEVDLGASVFRECLFGIGSRKSGIFVKQNDEAGTPLSKATSKLTGWA